MVVANHRSFFDAIVGLVVVHRRGRYPGVIVAEHWFKRRLIGMLLRSAGGDDHVIPIDSDAAADTERVRERMVKLLHEASEFRSADAAEYR